MSMKLNELEYKGLNLFDEIGTVEIALHEQQQTIHVYDNQQIVEPEYNFATRNYVLSEGFYKMATVLKQKQFFGEKNEFSVEEWIDSITWHFYCSIKSIKTYQNKQMIVADAEEIAQYTEQQLNNYGFYPKYVHKINGY